MPGANTDDAPDFEGSDGELEGLLMEGLASRELSEDEFWNAVDSTTNAMLGPHDSAQSA